MSDAGELFENQVVIKMEPELRHVLAHLYYAIEALVENSPISAMDNLKCVEGLIMFDGTSHADWDEYYREFSEWKKQREKRRKKLAKKQVKKPAQSAKAVAQSAKVAKTVKESK